MSLSMKSVFKQILVSRIIDIEISLNSHIGKGSVEIMQSKIKDYGLGHEVTNTLNTGIIMKIDQWKQKVKEKVIEKEHHEWIATGLMYRSVKEFKSLEVSIKIGWGWWQISRSDCRLLKDLKFMLNVLCINNLKCGHNCKCNDQHSKTHTLFVCINN